MEEIKSIIDDLGNDSLEKSIGIAGIAVISDEGQLIYQTENFDVKNQTASILSAIDGKNSFTVSGSAFNVVERKSEGIIGTNEAGMGHLIIVPVHGGYLVSYALPQADPTKCLTFILDHSNKLNGKL